MSDVTDQYIVRAEHVPEAQYLSLGSALAKTMQHQGWMVEQVSFITAAGRFEVKLTQGLVVSPQAKYSWTNPSGSWTHRRSNFKGEPEELVKLFHSGRLRQETLEKAGHHSPTWTVSRSLQKVYGAKRIRG